MMNMKPPDEEDLKRDVEQPKNKVYDIPGFKPVTFEQKERRPKMFNRSDPYVPPEKDTRYQVNKPETTKLDTSYSKMRE